MKTNAKKILKIINLLTELGNDFLQYLGDATLIPLVIDEDNNKKSQQELKDHLFLNTARKLDLFYNRFINRR